MASKKELKALITLAGKVDPSLQAALVKTTGNTKKLSENLKESSNQASKFGDMFKASFLGNMAANAVSKITSKIIELGQESISLSSDLVEVQNVVDTTFGQNAMQINEWAKTTLKAYGITELQAKQWSGSMGAMLKSSGVTSDDMLIMSTQLAGLAGDFASFYNLDHDAAWQKVKSGISGETEPLKELGINMSVANLEAFALANGIKKAYKDMNQGEQTLLRYNYLMERSQDAQGDFSKSLDTSWENQKRLLTNTIMDKTSAALSKFIPLLTELTAKSVAFVEKIDIDKVSLSIENGFKLAGDAVGWLKDNIDWLIPVASGLVGTILAFSVINTMVSAFKKWQLATEGMTIAQALLNTTMLANPIMWIALAIGALIAIGIALWKNWDTVKAKAIELWGSLQETFNGVGEWFGSLWVGVKEGFKSFVNFIIGGINKIPEALNAIQITVPDWVPGVGGKSIGFNIPTIPMFARGGIATQPSIFGEAGPEMAIPLKRTSRSLQLLNQTADILGVSNLFDSIKTLNGVENRKIELPSFNNLGKQEKSVIQKVAQITIQVMGEVTEKSAMDIKAKVKEVLEELEYEEGVVSFG